MSFLTELEPQMSCRAVWHINRKKIIRSASPKYLDARTRSATRAGPQSYVYPANSFRGDDELVS
eukprot:8217651-Pyramimonas_sp.AAC.1